MSQKNTKLYQSIVRELISNSNSKVEKQDKIYHKKKGYKAYGLRIPVVKKLINKHKPLFKDLTLSKRFELATKFYRSGFAEEGRIGNAILALSIKDLNPGHFGRLDDILGWFNNWDEVDDFSLNIIQPLLGRFPKETLQLLKKWNKARNLWKRRTSVVSFTRKIGESGKFTNEALSLCNNLVRDNEDLVQKAVGWALKDAMRGEKRKVLSYVKDLRRKGVSSTITLYAIRDLRGIEKEKVLTIKPLKADQKKDDK